MNYKPVLLMGISVIIGATALGAMNVSAQQADEDVEWKGRHSLHYGEGMRQQGKRHGHKHVEELLGLSRDEVRDELQSGKTMEEIVTTHGYESIESFKDAVEKKIREDLASRGISEEDIEQKIEMHNERMENRQQRIEDGS